MKGLAKYQPLTDQQGNWSREKRPLPSREEILQWYYYDGYQLVDRKTGDYAKRSGVHERGYWKVRVGERWFYAHRLIWKIIYNQDPIGFIDHWNGNPQDNMFYNLRDVTHAQNMRNRRPGKRIYFRENPKIRRPKQLELPLK